GVELKTSWSGSLFGDRISRVQQSGCVCRTQVMPIALTHCTFIYPLRFKKLSKKELSEELSQIAQNLDAARLKTAVRNIVRVGRI
ncbi:MAG TPA: hypothetical protein V6C57_28185, partial [Coleofasciculaceae cyanobacterium]